MNQRTDRPPAISADLLASFRAELEGRQYAPNTINFYLQVVGELGRVIEEARRRTRSCRRMEHAPAEVRSLRGEALRGIPRRDRGCDADADGTGPGKARSAL
jgi:hypothetical protein